MKKQAFKMAGQAPKHVAWGVISSPAGKLLIGVTDKGEICRVSYLRKSAPIEKIAEWQSEWPRTHFTRGATTVDIDQQPLLMVGTAFQQKVWRLIAQIPAGKALSYGEVAKRIGHPGAARAVGSACGANPIAYVVPCHRVVAANSLGGFSSQPEIKKELLKAEGYL